MEKLTGKNILIISPEPWGKSFISKHHYAEKLSEFNNNIFFLNPPCGSWKLNFYQTAKNSAIKIIDYKPAMRGINKLPNFIQSRISQKDAYKILAETGPVDVVWSFDPFRFQEMDVFGARLNIYHAVDLHKTNLERRIANSADLVLAVSDKIKDQISTIKPKYFINHGLADHFLKFTKFEKKLKSNAIKVGFVGNKQKRDIDFKSIKKIILNHPKLKFYFIGPNDRSNKQVSNFWNQLNNKNNVFLIEEVTSKKLPKMVSEFDIFILCSRITNNAISVSNSHKLLEYLITGKVVVSHFVDQYKDKKDLIQMPSSNSSFEDTFSHVVENLDFYNDPAKQSKRKKFAMDNSYSNQLLRIDKIIRYNLLL